KCTASHGDLKTIAEQTIDGLVWQEVNILEQIDHAVDLGVLTVPAIAIDGELVFASLPTSQQLRAELLRRRDGKN
ncbi:MAG: glutaredoxin, partial [Alicycliphilus sp. 69-12]